MFSIILHNTINILHISYVWDCSLLQKSAIWLARNLTHGMLTCLIIIRCTEEYWFWVRIKLQLVQGRRVDPGKRAVVLFPGNEKKNYVFSRFSETHCNYYRSLQEFRSIHSNLQTPSPLTHVLFEWGVHKYIFQLPIELRKLIIEFGQDFNTCVLPQLQPFLDFTIINEQLIKLYIPLRL